MIFFFSRMRYSKLVFLDIFLFKIESMFFKSSFRGNLNVCDLFFLLKLNYYTYGDLFEALSDLQINKTLYLYKKINTSVNCFVFINYFLNISNKFNENFFYCVIKLNIIERDCLNKYFEINFLKLIIYILFIRKYYGKYNNKLFNKK